MRQSGFDRLPRLALSGSCRARQFGLGIPADFARNRGMDDSLTARLLKVESALAHLEHQHEELNGVVVEQARVIARLQKELGRATQALESAELERIRSNNQKPPHYQ